MLLIFLVFCSFYVLISHLYRRIKDMGFSLEAHFEDMVGLIDAHLEDDPNSESLLQIREMLKVHYEYARESTKMNKVVALERF